MLRILEMTGLEKQIIQEVSKLNLVRTIYKRKVIESFIQTSRVEGWDDPRLPTLRVTQNIID